MVKKGCGPAFGRSVLRRRSIDLKEGRPALPPRFPQLGAANQFPDQ